MSSTIKVTNSTAIRAEVKRHESLQNTLNKFLRQLEKVEDPQIRTGLKVFLHSVQGELADRFKSQTYCFCPPVRLMIDHNIIFCKTLGIF